MIQTNLQPMRLSQNLTFSWRTICCFKDKKKKTNVNNGGLLTSCPAIGQISDTHTPSQIGITTMFVNSFNHCSRQIRDITTWALQQQAYKDDISRILKRTTSYYFRTSMKGREICYFGHSMRKISPVVKYGCWRNSRITLGSSSSQNQVLSS